MDVSPRGRRRRTGRAVRRAAPRPHGVAQVGGAVERNKVKRLIREAFSAESPALPAGLDVVVQARPDARELAERDGLEGIRTALGELIAKAASEAPGA